MNYPFRVWWTRSDGKREVVNYYGAKREWFGDCEIERGQGMGNGEFSRVKPETLNWEPGVDEVELGTVESIPA